MTYAEITFEVVSNVAWITINRPAALNAISIVVARELNDAAALCESRQDVRAVVLTGAGDRAFCAGGDVLAFAEDPQMVDVVIKEMTTHLHCAIGRFTRLRAPVIAAVNGTVAGGGLGLFASADLAIAVDTAQFTSAYTKIGLTPDGSSTYFLSRLIGRRRAMELYLTNRVLSAGEALQWGLVNTVVPADRFREEVSTLAVRLACGPTSAHGAIKRLLLSALDETLERQMDAEAEFIMMASRSRDGIEGVDAFKNKRKPRFEG